jgi:UDP-N-acetylglucosamine 2-epimerase (non-hydrolysing)
VHVEAGVRSGDLENPWPEEGFRREITGLADWHYAPTAHCFANLVAEGVNPSRIRVTGNSVVSALARYTAARPSPAEDHILVTLHRRELLQSSEFRNVVQAIIDEAGAPQCQLKFLWPVHPATLPLLGDFEGPPNFLLGNPLSYVNFAGWLATAVGVLTDSGGLQEEAATLGVPCAVLRKATDRPESVQAGLAACFSPDGAGVHSAISWLLGSRIRAPSAIFGEVGAAAAIARLLAAL